MTVRQRPLWNRAALGATAIAVAGGVLAAVGGFAQTDAPPEEPTPVRAKILAKGPDVRVFSLSTPSSNGGASFKSRWADLAER